MTSALTLPYGKGRVELKVADSARFDFLASAKPLRVADETTAVAEALARPIGKPPLREIVRPGETVAILVNDITRLTRTDLMLPPILEVLNAAGVPDRDIFVVFALGIHRQQTEAEQHQIVGDEIYVRISYFDHICTDDGNLIAIGKTSFGNVVEVNRTVWEADRIILTGEIVYHLIAGYSGGRKSLVPGVAGQRTTTFNHSMIFDPRSRSGVLDGNPAHEHLLEACRMIDPDFIVNVVLSPEGDLIRVVAGHYDLAHREGCHTVDRMLRADFDAPFRCINCVGGRPPDRYRPATDA